MDITHKTIGILGVTPEGASKAYRDLSIAFYRTFGNYRNPNILLYTQPLERHVTSFGQEAKWIALLQEGIDTLIRSGAELIWMPANSSHLVVGQLDFKGIPFVNMVEASIDALAQTKETPLVLGTKISVSEKLYFKDPARLSHCMRPDEGEQEKINDIIVKELVVGSLSVESSDYLHDLVKRYTDKGADSLFLACTELPCFLEDGAFGLPEKDSISVSIGEVLKHME